MKPIKWGFKWCFRCTGSSGYLFKFDFYLGKQKAVEVNLTESVVLQLSEKLKNTALYILIIGSVKRFSFF